MNIDQLCVTSTTAGKKFVLTDQSSSPAAGSEFGEKRRLDVPKYSRDTRPLRLASVDPQVSRFHRSAWPEIGCSDCYKLYTAR